MLSSIIIYQKYHLKPCYNYYNIGMHTNTENIEPNIDSDYDHVIIDKDKDKDKDEHNYTDSESDNSTDSESEINLYFGHHTLKTNSERYIIVKDNLHLGYTDSIEKAREYMWTIAREYKTNWYADYFTYIKETNCDHIQIMGSHRFLFLRYERLFSTFEIHTINEIINTVDTSTPTVDTSTIIPTVCKSDSKCTTTSSCVIE